MTNITKDNLHEKLHSWINSTSLIDNQLADHIHQFFELCMEHLKEPDHAWFGITKSSTSLMIGGIYLGAINISSGDNRGLWLLINEPLSLPFGEEREVKSTVDSSAPLIWFRLWPLNELEQVIINKTIWKSYEQATALVRKSSKSSAPRDQTHIDLGKVRLNDLFQSTLSVFPDEVDSLRTFQEGATIKKLVNAYERNQNARQECIAKYGTNCSICEFDFEKRYGQIGSGVIHVHHLRPLSEIKSKYEVDPVNDLRPVCPNCHVILHRRTPPYSIKEVQDMLKG